MRLRDANTVYSSVASTYICENANTDEDGNRYRNDVSISDTILIHGTPADDNAFHLNVKVSERLNGLSSSNADVDFVENNGNPDSNSQQQLAIGRLRLDSETNSVSSRDDSLADCEGQSSSSVDIFPQGDEYQCFSQEDATDSDFSEDPQHDDNGNGINNLVNSSIDKEFYDKPKFDIPDDDDKDFRVFPEINFVISSNNHKFEFSPKETYEDSGVCSTDSEFDHEFSFLVETTHLPISSVSETAILSEDDSDDSPLVDNHTMKAVKDLVNEKKYARAKPEFSPSISLSSDLNVSPTKWVSQTRKTSDEVYRRQNVRAATINRRSLPPSTGDKKLHEIDAFDVYNIETSMPKIDLDAIESHLKAAREAERRRKNDREEIRRRLAMGTDTDEYSSGWERIGRKPSLQSRLQGGMNLQICFMNDTGSDSESNGPDSSLPPHSTCDHKRPVSLPIKTEELDAFFKEGLSGPRPSTAKLTLPLKKEQPVFRTEADLFAFQARLQAEARAALMQAKEIARMQMINERQQMPVSPITQMVRNSLTKVGVPFPEDRRRFSRQILTEMNVAQLQIIVNDLHTQIETLNEDLVKYLMNRDDLHMEQDSMLVDIEDLTRYLGAKEKLLESAIQLNNNHKGRTHHLPAQKSA